MAAKESNFKNMVLALFAITFFASAALGLVNEVTKSAIEKANVDAQNKAISAVLPKFDHLGKSFRVLPEGEADSLEFFPALDINNHNIATAVKTYSKKGFGGLFTVMVGIDSNGVITGYNVLEHHETPGLGSKMGQWFSDKSKPNQNIIGKNPAVDNFTVTKDGGSIDAITAATISSRAFLGSIQRAFNAWKSTQKEQTGMEKENNETKTAENK